MSDGYILKSGKILSVSYADCKSRRMRKKLEETNESSRLTSIESDKNDVLINDRININLNDDVFINNQDLDDDSKHRRDSFCSEYSSDSTSTNQSVIECGGGDLWFDLWSKILKTNNWNEYKLF